VARLIATASVGGDDASDSLHIIASDDNDTDISDNSDNGSENKRSTKYSALRGGWIKARLSDIEREIEALVAAMISFNQQRAPGLNQDSRSRVCLYLSVFPR